MARRKADTSTVSFRFDGHNHELLRGQAAARGMSPGEYAREVVRDALHDLRAKQMLLDLSELRKELERAFLELKRHLQTQRQHLRNATICLLVDVGNIQLADAEQFVKEHMAD